MNDKLDPSLEAMTKATRLAFGTSAALGAVCSGACLYKGIKTQELIESRPQESTHLQELAGKAYFSAGGAGILTAVVLAGTLIIERLRTRYYNTRNLYK